MSAMVYLDGAPVGGLLGLDITTSRLVPEGQMFFLPKDPISGQIVITNPKTAESLKHFILLEQERAWVRAMVRRMFAELEAKWGLNGDARCSCGHGKGWHDRAQDEAGNEINPCLECPCRQYDQVSISVVN